MEVCTLQIPHRRKFLMLKSANKTETNIYTLEVSVSGEDFNKARRTRFSFPVSVRVKLRLK